MPLLLNYPLYPVGTAGTYRGRVTTNLYGQTISAEIEANLNLTYDRLSGIPPPPYSHFLKPWVINHAYRRLANVPRTRTTNLYWSSSGSDANNGLTSGAPVLTTSKIETLINATNGDVCVHIAGGTYQPATVQTLTVTKDNITFLGDASDLPLMSAFNKQYTTGWTHDSGDLYHRTETTDIGWVREGNDTNFPFVHGPYTRMDSSANVATTPHSWFYNSGTTTLYINAGASVNPNTLTGGHEACPKVQGVWQLFGDNIRLENIRFAGQGVNYPGGGQSYQIQFASSKLHAEYVMVNVEALIGGYHNVGCTGNAANILTCVNCRFGLGTHDPDGGGVVVVAYSDTGGQEMVLIDCEIAGGALPNYAPPPQLYLPYFAHTNGVGGTKPALMVSLRTKFPDVPNQVLICCTIDGPVVTQPEDVRGYIIEEKPESTVHPGIEEAQMNMAIINGYYDTGSRGTESGSLSAVAIFDGPCGAWVYNTTIKADITGASNFGPPFAWFFGNGSTIKIRMDNCRLQLDGDPLSGFVFTQADSSTIGTGTYIRNTEIIFNSNAYTPTVNNTGWTADNLLSNAYYCKNSVSSFTAVDIGAVVLRSIPVDNAVPVYGDQLFGMGSENLLDGDQFGNPRTPGRYDIGPTAGTALLIDVVVKSTEPDQNIVENSTARPWWNENTLMIKGKDSDGKQSVSEIITLAQPIFTDTFTGANGNLTGHTPDSGGSAWTVAAGTWLISSNNLIYQNGSASGLLVIYRDIGISRLIMRVKYKTPVTGTWNGYFQVNRKLDGTSWNFGLPSNGVLEIYEPDNTAHYPSFTAANNTEYDIEILADGDHIRYSVNGVVYYEVTPTGRGNKDETRIGFSHYDDGTVVSPIWEQVTVTAIDDSGRPTGTYTLASLTNITVQNGIITAVS